MYILTNRTNVIVYISTEANLKEDGIHVGGGIIFTDKTLNILNVEVPSNIIPQKYCYTEERGFYINNAYVSRDDSTINDKVNYILNKVDPIIDENQLTLEEMKELQTKRVGDECQTVIMNGLDVEISTGVEHFSLTLEDQSNMDKVLNKIKMGLTEVPYHSDNNICKIYSAEDFIKIYNEADLFILYQTTYVNHINTWIRRCTSKEEIKEISFSSKLPEDLQQSLNTIMITIEEALKNL